MRKNKHVGANETGVGNRMANQFRSEDTTDFLLWIGPMQGETTKQTTKTEDGVRVPLDVDDARRSGHKQMLGWL
jgi:hypothetical protein